MTKGSSALGLLLICASGACASTTSVVSEPRGAQVEIEGRGVIGRTPLVLRETPWVWSEHTLRVSKPGYVTQRVRRKAGASAGSLAGCVAGCLVTWVVWPIGLMGEYDSAEIKLKLAPRGGAKAAKKARATGVEFSEAARALGP